MAEVDIKTINNRKIQDVDGREETRKLSLKVDDLTNSKIDNINKSLETCKFLNEWNKYNTAYEKMHLDYYLYLLSHYYKEDLKTVNEWLLTIFKALRQ